MVTLQGEFFRKIFGVWNFYANQLIFRIKQPYTLSFVEISLGVVTHLSDFTENPPPFKFILLHMNGIKRWGVGKWGKIIYYGDRAGSRPVKGVGGVDGIVLHGSGYIVV